jgi:ElaB/YqjD/DUF883 family membrane-anchored ribosome-binding protein
MRANAQQTDTTRQTRSDASQAHHALKTAGRNAKAGLKNTGSSIHHTLKSAGNKTKAALKRATGDTVPHPHHKPGGLNKVARSISGDMKSVGRKAKSTLKHVSGQTHHVLKRTGNNVKTGLKGQGTDTTKH